jgi:hypothetical protein
MLWYSCTGQTNKNDKREDSMRRINVLSFAAIAMVGLGGCSTLPGSADGLRQARQPAAEVCTQLSVDDAAERVRAGWRGCHFMGPSGPGEQAAMVNKLPVLVPTAPGHGDYIRVDRSDDRLTVVKGPLKSVISAGPSVQLMADVEQTQACKARVKAWGANALWDRAADEIRDYLANPDQSCRK